MTAPTTEPPAQPTTPPAGEPPKEPGTTAPAKDDKGPAGGEKAILADLAKEREARKELQKQIEALSPLTKLAEALGVKPEPGKTDVETLTQQVAALQQQQKDAELRAIRLEVAAEKGLTPQQAARLSGSTREELAKDADDLKALFPGTQPPGTPGTPRPDPSQGPRGSVPELQAALKAAQEKGDAKESIRLKAIIADQKRNK